MLKRWDIEGTFMGCISAGRFHLHIEDSKQRLNSSQATWGSNVSREHVTAYKPPQKEHICSVYLWEAELGLIDGWKLYWDRFRSNVRKKFLITKANSLMHLFNRNALIIT